MCGLCNTRQPCLARVRTSQPGPTGGGPWSGALKGGTRGARGQGPRPVARVVGASGAWDAGDGRGYRPRARVVRACWARCRNTLLTHKPLGTRYTLCDRAAWQAQCAIVAATTAGRGAETLDAPVCAQGTVQGRATAIAVLAQRAHRSAGLQCSGADAVVPHSNGDGGSGPRWAVHAVTAAGLHRCSAGACLHTRNHTTTQPHM